MTTALNMPVPSDGTPFDGLSFTCAYSNSKPTMSRLTPIEKPVADRVASVGEKPTNAVASAAAVRGRIVSTASVNRAIVAMRFMSPSIGAGRAARPVKVKDEAPGTAGRSPRILVIPFS